METYERRMGTYQVEIDDYRRRTRAPAGRTGEVLYGREVAEQRAGDVNMSGQAEENESRGGFTAFNG